MPDLHERAQTALGDRYRIERELGRGGMATVFLAEDLKHQRPVAVKILHPDIASNIGSDRFRREIEFAAHLNHPHVLALIDSGEDGGLLWYAMPYVEGESLRHRLERVGKLSLAEAAEIARQTATALDYAHSHGVLHRDIKPENLLLAHDHVWVADFGIARALRRSESSEATGVFVIGTPAYMSPEQGRGDDDIDGRSDVYSLATVIYEVLAGNAPFKGDTPGKIFARRELDPPPRLRTVRADLPAAAETAVHRGLALDPKDRQPTAGKFAEELGGTVTSPQVARAARRASRRTLTATVLAAAVIGLVIWWWTRPPHFDDNRILILMPQPDPAGDPEFNGDVATALETQLAAMTTLLPRLLSEPSGGASVMPPDSTLDRLSATYRMRFTVALRVSDTDSLRVTASVLDAASLSRGPQVLITALRSGTPAWEAAAALARAALPVFLPTGGRLDPALIGRQRLDALAEFLLGERAYRRGRFPEADSLFARAMELDSSFAWAALRGAQAASWNTDHTRAVELIQRAEPYLAPLGSRVSAFAEGLKAYQEGDAEAALTSLRSALALDPQWSEAWMALAEVYHHLLPMDGAVVDSAMMGFAAARRFDPGFEPPVVHQFQLAVWTRRSTEAESLFTILEASGLQSVLLERARVTLNACIRGKGRPEWDRAGREEIGVLRNAAVDLAVGGLEQPGCATEALQAALRADTSDIWPTYLHGALAHVYAARGQPDSAAAILMDPEIGSQGEVLLIMFAIAGLPFERQADSVAPLIAAEEFDTTRPHLTSQPRLRRLWAVGAWAVHRERLPVARMSEEILARVAASDTVRQSLRRMAALFARSLKGRRLVAQGDSSRALAVLDSLVPTGGFQEMRWLPWEALAHERFLRAQLLEAAGQNGRAYLVAGGFDSPASYGLLLYLPQSIELRIRVAEKLGLMPYQRRLEERLAQLRTPKARNPVP
jgi:Tfp pilus assembly protein PilF/tRNA A-37 threonylcarbamoyl transferase component Bud32